MGEVFIRLDRSGTMDAPWTWTLLAGAFLLTCCCFFLFFKDRKQTKNKYNLPPGPPPWPIIGNLNLLLDSTKPAYQIVNDLTKIYGPLMLLKIGAQNFVFVSGPEMAMEFLKVQDHLFAHRPAAMFSASYLMYGDKHLTMGNQGDYHNFFRKLLVNELLGPKKLQASQSVRMEEYNSFIREVYNAAVRTQPVNLHDKIHVMTLNVISTISFSTKFFGPGANDKLSKSQQRWTHFIPEMTDCFSIVLAETCHPSLRWVDTLTGTRKRMQTCFRGMDFLLQEILANHKKDLDALSPKDRGEYEAKDVMDILLLLGSGERSEFVDDNAIKAVSMDLIVAGSESSSAVLEWAMTELLIHPEVMKKAQEEVDGVVGKERLVSEEDLGRMPYLAAVVKETFRLHEPVPWLLPHSNRVPCKVGGYDIPANSFVNVNVYGMSRNPLHWEDPLKFDPDRFLRGESAVVDTKGSYPQLLPFGSGRRICPAIAFSNTFIHASLARAIHSFDWSIPRGQAASNLDISERLAAVAGKRKNLEAVATPRLAAHVYSSL